MLSDPTESEKNRFPQNPRYRHRLRLWARNPLGGLIFIPALRQSPASESVAAMVRHNSRFWLFISPSRHCLRRPPRFSPVKRF